VLANRDISEGGTVPGVSCRQQLPHTPEWLGRFVVKRVWRLLLELGESL
jgi:hypothetical protein